MIAPAAQPRHGRPRMFSDAQEAAIADQYAGGDITSVLCLRHGCSPAGLLALLKRRGVEIRKPGGRHYDKPRNRLTSAGWSTAITQARTFDESRAIEDALAPSIGHEYAVALNETDSGYVPQEVEESLAN